MFLLKKTGYELDLVLEKGSQHLAIKIIIHGFGLDEFLNSASL